MGGAFFGKDGFNYFILLLLIPFGYIIMIFYGKLSKQNLHFSKILNLALSLKNK